MELTEFDTVEIPNIGPVLRVTCPAQVTNTEAWDEYIDKMLFIIDYLLRLGEQYKKCFCPSYLSSPASFFPQKMPRMQQAQLRAM